MQLKYLILSLLILSLIITSISIVQVKAQTTANITQLEQEIQQLNETLQSLLNRTSAYYPVSVPSWLDSGSNAWMLTAATLVGLQSVPGVALYYAGLVKKKYAVNTAAMILYAFAAVLIVWMLAGYNFGFGPSSIKIGTIYISLRNT